MIQIEADAPPLLVMRKKRHRPKVGDVFAFQLADGLYRFGRVFHTAVPIGGKDDCGNLVVAYRYEAETIGECPPHLLPDDALGPPMVVSSRPWSLGYFAHLHCRPFEREEVPHPGPCLFDYYADKCRGPDGSFVRKNPRLMGTWALTGYLAVGTELIAAVNVPKAR